MIQTVRVPIRNVSCDACEKVLGRLLKRFPHTEIVSISKDAQTLSLSCEEGDLPAIKEKLREYHYLDEQADEKSHFSHIVGNILRNRSGFQAENELLTHSFLLLAILVLVFGAMFLFWFNQSILFQKLFSILLLVPVGISMNVGALLHVRQLRQHFNCTNGMMAGMIIGMVSGFTAGALIGATNGMFVGSIFGMLIGMGVSAYAVRRSGIMGILEGLMAGLMAGTMGAMLSVMMVTDHLVLFLYILFAVCALILAGMSYFLIKEIGPIHEEKRNTPFFPLALVGVLVLFFIVALVLFGPKSSIAFGGLV